MSTVAADRAEASVLACILFAHASIMFGCAAVTYGLLTN